MRTVFISYSRKDGASAARHLYETMKCVGFDPWLDTERLRGGAYWTQEIEAALRKCEVMVAVLTPASFVSRMCIAEQVWFLDAGKRIIPVVAVPNAPRPFYLHPLNYLSFPEEEQKLLEDLNTQATAGNPGVRPLRYDTIPSPPRYLIPRHAALARLRDLMFSEDDQGSGALIAVVGMGGIGKTVIVSEVCRDPAVQRAFPDGIAWITIGREWDGDVVVRMREVAKALGDDLSGYQSSSACVNSYRTFLRDKAALVVVDDIWNAQDLKPFLAHAPQSRFLFTTRDLGIAKGETHRIYSPGLPTDDESHAILARSSGIARDKLPSEAADILRLCGRLPVAVAQLGAMLSDYSREEWHDAVATLEAADINDIEGRLPKGQESFFKSLSASVEALETRRQQAYLRLAWLLEDVAASPPVLATLWNLNERDTREAARFFVERSLATWRDEKDPALGIRLHDLQLDYVRARFADEDSLKLIHQSIRLSAKTISDRPHEFASQMAGRLLPYSNVAAVAAFIADLSEGAPRPWLKPVWPALRPPATGLIRMMGQSQMSALTFTQEIMPLALSHDGRYALAPTEEGAIAVWDLEAGRKVREFSGHSGDVSGIVISEDDKETLSAGSDGRFIFWDVNTGDVVRYLQANPLPDGVTFSSSDGVRALAATPNLTRVVSGSSDGHIKIWDFTATSTPHEIAAHSGPVNALAITRDGRWMISGSEDCTVSVWDLENMSEGRTLGGHSQSVRSVVITDDGERAVSGDEEGTIRVWDVATGKERRTLSAHSSAVNGLALATDGRLISASDDLTIKVWNLERGKELRSLQTHDSVKAVAVMPGGKRAVSVSSDYKLQVWDLNCCLELQLPATTGSTVYGVAVSRNAPRRAVTIGSIDAGDYGLTLWDVETGQKLRDWCAHENLVKGIAVTANGQAAVSASWDRSLKIWDLSTGNEMASLNSDTAIDRVSITPDGLRAVTNSDDRTVRVWDLAAGKLLASLSGHTDTVTAVAITPDGERALSMSSDRTLKVWDLAAQTCICARQIHSFSLAPLVVTNDSQYALYADSEGILKLWDLARYEDVLTMRGHCGQVWGLAVSPDGQFAASASWDETVRVWELDTGKNIASFTCDGAAICCAFAANDQILVGDEAGRVFLLMLER